MQKIKCIRLPAQLARHCSPCTGARQNSLDLNSLNRTKGKAGKQVATAMASVRTHKNVGLLNHHRSMNCSEGPERQNLAITNINKISGKTMRTIYVYIYICSYRVAKPVVELRFLLISSGSASGSIKKDLPQQCEIHSPWLKRGRIHPVAPGGTPGSQKQPTRLSAVRFLCSIPSQQRYLSATPGHPIPQQHHWLSAHMWGQQPRDPQKLWLSFRPPLHWDLSNTWVKH